MRRLAPPAALLAAVVLAALAPATASAVPVRDRMRCSREETLSPSATATVDASPSVAASCSAPATGALPATASAPATEAAVGTPAVGAAMLPPAPGAEAEDTSDGAAAGPAGPAAAAAATASAAPRHDLFSCSKAPPTSLAKAPVPRPPAASAQALGTPDLVLVETVSPRQALPAGTVTYTLLLENEGTAEASGVMVVDDYDERYLAVAGAGEGTVAGGTVSWELGTLGPGASVTLTYRARLAAGTPGSVTQVDGVAVASAAEEPDRSDNTARTRLGIVHTASSAAPGGFEPLAAGDGMTPAGASRDPGALPYTGGPTASWMLLAAVFSLVGGVLRRASRRDRPISHGSGLVLPSAGRTSGGSKACASWSLGERASSARWW